MERRNFLKLFGVGLAAPLLVTDADTAMADNIPLTVRSLAGEAISGVHVSNAVTISHDGSTYEVLMQRVK